MTDRELLDRAIKASGLSVNQYAATVLVRDARTVRRWLSGEQALPLAIRRWLESQVEERAP